MRYTEDEILHKFKKGESLGFKGIFDTYYKDVVYFAWKLVGSKEDAEDLTMYVFERLFQKHLHFDTANNVKAFLFISIRNLCLNFLRDKRRRDVLHNQFLEYMTNDTNLAIEYEVKPEVIRAVVKAIKSLPDKYQHVFHLLMIEGKKPSEVAELLQISVNNVYLQKNRALNLLRLQLNDKNLSISALLYLIYFFLQKI